MVRFAQSNAVAEKHFKSENYVFYSSAANGNHVLKCMYVHALLMNFELSRPLDGFIIFYQITKPYLNIKRVTGNIHFYICNGCRNSNQTLSSSSFCNLHSITNKIFAYVSIPLKLDEKIQQKFALKSEKPIFSLSFLLAMFVH